jgi:hypothetical protein
MFPSCEHALDPAGYIYKFFSTIEQNIYSTKKASLLFTACCIKAINSLTCRVQSYIKIVS